MEGERAWVFEVGQRAFPIEKSSPALLLTQGVWKRMARRIWASLPTAGGFKAGWQHEAVTAP